MTWFLNIKKKMIIFSVQKQYSLFYRCRSKDYYDIVDNSFTIITLNLESGTQAEMKKWNRRCEWKLREAELLLSVALIMQRVPSAQIDDLVAVIKEAWRLLMVNQFHDVLPGTSIEMVHKEAKEWFVECFRSAERVIHQSLLFLGAGKGAANSVLNTLPWSRDCLVYEKDVAVEAVTVAPMSWKSLPLEINHPLRIGTINSSPIVASSLEQRFLYSGQVLIPLFGICKDSIRICFKSLNSFLSGICKYET